MQRLFTLSAAALALVSAGGLKQQGCGDKCDEIRRFEREAAQARKDRRVHLVDLDDHDRLKEIEDDGLCINIGDLIFVTGIEDAANGQEWEEYGGLLDTSILQITADADIKVTTPPLGFN